MNAIQIDNDVRRVDGTERYFRGVYSSDNMPSLTPPYCFIVNSEPSDQPGDHWLAFWVNKDSVEFFDTYGRTPYMFDNAFTVFLRGRKCFYNSVVLEGIFSKTCGQFSIYYICLRCFGFSFDEISNSFSSNVIVNDKFVKKFVALI